MLVPTLIIMKDISELKRLELVARKQAIQLSVTHKRTLSTKNICTIGLNYLLISRFRCETLCGNYVKRDQLTLCVRVTKISK